MAIQQLHSDYCQKSKTFLFPALCIRRGDYTKNLMTFIHWPGKYTLKDMRLMICKSDDMEDENALGFEETQLIQSHLFEYSCMVDRRTKAWVYNLGEKYAADWHYFLKGRYSQLSDLLKEQIRIYFGDTSNEWEIIRSFLYPAEYFDLYAELMYDEKDRIAGLGILKRCGELCSPYDPLTETLKIIQVPSGHIVM